MDPLSRRVRYLLRVQHGLTEGIDVLLSTEAPRVPLVPLDDSVQNPANYQVCNLGFLGRVSGMGPLVFSARLYRLLSLELD